MASRRTLSPVGLAVGLLCLALTPASAQYTIDPSSVTCFPYTTCLVWLNGSGYFAAINVQGKCLDPGFSVSASYTIKVNFGCDNVVGSLEGGYDDTSIYATATGYDVVSGLEGEGQSVDDCNIGIDNFGGGQYPCTFSLWNWILSWF